MKNPVLFSRPVDSVSIPYLYLFMQEMSHACALTGTTCFQQFFLFLYRLLLPFILSSLSHFPLILSSPSSLLVHQIMLKRRDLKIVVMSATLDALKFQQYFDNAPLMKVTYIFRSHTMYLTLNRLSICPFVCLAGQFVRLSICLPFCLSVHLSVCLLIFFCHDFFLNPVL